jgi:oligoribonuclease NrnB/cAMP/cGMP phosphodiesterase (DHH superfamily)
MNTARINAAKDGHLSAGMNTTSLCIYHGNCADGFGAAWVVWQALGLTEDQFFAGTYQDPPPDVRGRDVIMVDFSYKRPVIEKMLEECQSLLIIDHHKTAIEDLSGLLATDHFTTLFDVDHSGAILAWDFFYPGKAPPQLLRHIEDRDLWRFALDGTREIQACLFSYPYDFQVWDRLIRGWDTSSLRLEGAAIERKHHKDVAELVEVTKRPIEIAGYRVQACSLPYTLTSDAGHLLCEQGNAFGVCYWDTPEGRVFSLRSLGGGVDVSEIAKRYGGGGHRNAAGFRVSFSEAAKFEVEKGQEIISTIADYYDSKDREARRLADELKAVQERGAPSAEIKRLTSRLEMARYVGD